MSKGIPKILLESAKWAYLNNPIRVYSIQRQQHRDLETRYPLNAKRLIVFLTPGRDVVNGGVMSIVSLCEESAKLKKIHEAEVFACTFPWDPPLFRYTQFKNDTVLYQLSQILEQFKDREEILFHVPEIAVRPFLKLVEKGRLPLGQGEVRFNILIQNIDGMPFDGSIPKLSKFGKVTGTTAHQAYTTKAIQKKFGHPILKFSTFVNPMIYTWKDFAKKEEIMIVSPDDQPRKAEVLEVLRKRFPNLKLQVIQKMTFQEYKELISRSKWALTFGEGLDGYFIEPIFSGAVSFSVYNDRFFTPDFKKLRTVYPNYDELIRRICNDMENLDRPREYEKYQGKEFWLLDKYYDYQTYLQNLSSYYKKYFRSPGRA
jgi:hypothetical protein